MAKLDYRWRLREVMAARGLWATTDLAPLLRARGIDLSAAQVYRLVTQTPERLSLKTLMALCDALDCNSTDLIEPIEVAVAPRKRKAVGAPGEGEVRPMRPKRARIVPER